MFTTFGDGSKPIVIYYMSLSYFGEYTSINQLELRVPSGYRLVLTHPRSMVSLGDGRIQFPEATAESFGPVDLTEI